MSNSSETWTFLPLCQLRLAAAAFFFLLIVSDSELKYLLSLGVRISTFIHLDDLTQDRFGTVRSGYG